MKGTGIILLVFLLILVGLNVGFGLLERILAKKANRGVGLVMPIFFFIISVMSILSAVEQTLPQMTAVDTLPAAIVLLVILFLFLNIPTIVTYVIYARTRRTMGEAPWPMKQKK
ncbi:MAG: hypothetical protein ACI4PM_00380 [Butyricicoccus sp.]